MASLQKRTWTNKTGEISTAWRVTYTDQSGRIRTKQFEKRGEAKQFRDTVTSQVAAGTHIHDRDSVTVVEAAKIWLKATMNGRDGRAPVEEHTYKGYKSLVDNHIVPRLGAIKLPRLTRATIATELRDAMLADGHSRILTKKVVVALGSILGEMVDLEMLAVNRARGIKVATKTRDGEEDDEKVCIPEPSRIRQILVQSEIWTREPPGIVLRGKLTRTPRFSKERARMFYMLLRLSIATGMRISEVLGLPRRNVDLSAGTVIVAQRLSRGGKIGKPKSKAGYRTLEISQDLVKELREWVLQRPKGELDLIFPNGSGNAESYNNIRSRFWLPLLLSIGAARRTTPDGGGGEVIESDFTIHGLRHFHASQYIATGADPLDVKTRMGHSSIQITYDIYGHLFQNEEAIARRRRQIEAMEADLLGVALPRAD